MRDRAGYFKAGADATTIAAVARAESMETLARAPSPEAVQEKLRAAAADKWVDGLVAELEPSSPCASCHRPRRQRWAYLLFAKAAKIVGAETQVLMMFLERFGIRSEQDATAIISAGKHFQQLTEGSKVSLEHQRDEAVELLTLILRERPQWRSEVIGRLEQPAAEASLAVRPRELVEAAGEADGAPSLHFSLAERDAYTGLSKIL